MRKILILSSLLLIFSLAFTGCYVTVPRSMAEDKILAFCDRITEFPDCSSLVNSTYRLGSNHFVKDVTVVRYVYDDDSGEYITEEVIENNSYETMLFYRHGKKLSSVSFKDQNDGIYDLFGKSSYTVEYFISEDGSEYAYKRYDGEKVTVSENEWQSALMADFYRYSPYSENGKILYIDEARENIYKIKSSLHSYRIYSKTENLDIEWTVIYAEDSVKLKFNTSVYERDSSSGRVLRRTDYHYTFYI